MNKKVVTYFIVLILLISLLFSLTSCIQQTTAHMTETSHISEISDDLQTHINEEKNTVQLNAKNETALKKETEKQEIIIPEKDIEKIKTIIHEDTIPELLLVSKKNPLEFEHFKDFITLNTLPATRELYLNELVVFQLEKLFADIKSNNINDLLVVSGYRDVEYQTMLFERQMNKYINNHTKEEAYDLASQSVAIPGTSEHHTGLAVDFISSTQYTLESTFDQTACGSWLKDNAYKYGFILRYPKDKTDITEIIYEPWHFRYVGKPHAEYMKVHNLCLEEYISLLKEESNINFIDEFGTDYNVTYIEDINTFDFNNSVITEDNIIEVSNLGNDSFIITTIN